MIAKSPKQGSVAKIEKVLCSGIDRHWLEENEDYKELLREGTKVDDVTKSLATTNWQWAGRVAEKDIERSTLRAGKWRPRNQNQRSNGRFSKQLHYYIKNVEGLLLLSPFRG